MAQGSPFITYLYMLLWIALSAGVILINKVILSHTAFHLPITLTAVHMAFCSSLAAILVKCKLAEAVTIPRDVYFSCVVPIGGLFALTLWLGNAAYLYLEVSFIQMLKASMPMVVYAVGCVFQTETFSKQRAINMLVVVTGILIASYGEIKFDVQGVTYQVSSLVSESIRLTLIQILLQSRGIKLNPIATLYHIAPCCLMFLLAPLAYLELMQLTALSSQDVPVVLLLCSAALAFALNLSIFMLIGRSSALTMNVAGVIKDWMLILLSVLLFGSLVTSTQLFGYGLAFLGVAYYNYQKFHAGPAAGGKVIEPLKSLKSAEQQPLLADGSRSSSADEESK